MSVAIVAVEEGITKDKTKKSSQDLFEIVVLIREAITDRKHKDVYNWLIGLTSEELKIVATKLVRRETIVDMANRMFNVELQEAPNSPTTENLSIIVEITTGAAKGVLLPPPK